MDCPRNGTTEQHLTNTSPKVASRTFSSRGKETNIKSKVLDKRWKYDNYCVLFPSWPWRHCVLLPQSPHDPDHWQFQGQRQREHLLIETFGLDNSFTKMTTSQWFCFCNTFSFFQRLDKGQDFEGKLIPKKFLPSLFHIIAQPVICTTSSSHERLRKQQHISISIYFLFIDDHLHTNFYTVMFHLVSINLLKLFLRFILFLSGSLYVGSYRPHIGLGARKCNFLESDGNSIFLNLVMKVWLSSSSAEARLSASNVRAFERKERKLKSANYSFFLLKI